MGAELAIAPQLPVPVVAAIAGAVALATVLIRPVAVEGFGRKDFSTAETRSTTTPKPEEVSVGFSFRAGAEAVACGSGSLTRGASRIGRRKVAAVCLTLGFTTLCGIQATAIGFP